MVTALILLASCAISLADLRIPERWKDATNTSQSEGNVITCTWGVVCQQGFQRRGEVEICGSNFECLPMPSASNVNNASSPGHQGPIELVEGRPLLYVPYHHGEFNSPHQISCPCGVHCSSGHHYVGLSRVCNSALRCRPC